MAYRLSLLKIGRGRNLVNIIKDSMICLSLLKIGRGRNLGKFETPTEISLSLLKIGRGRNRYSKNIVRR